MSSMSEDIQCAGSDTRPPMLDRTDFESWQQRIRLYYLGKDNRENIMQAQANDAVLDEEQSLFLAGEQVTNFDDDVDDSPENDLALNVDHIFEADQCDAFDSDVDEAPNVQTMFMVNLSSEDPIYDEAGPSHDSNTPFEYLEDNEENGVQSNVSSVQNDALMSIINEMHEEGVQQGVQSRLANKPDKVVNDSLTSELARYKELVGEYEKRAKFELTDRERKIDEQMRIIISDRNRKETSLKSELHSVQILLSSTVGHYKSKTEEVTILKKDFKQKEDKFLEEFLDIKRLKEKVEDRLYKQDQSVQTVHMSKTLLTKASRSKPRSNTKKNRILPAKPENKKKVICDSDLKLPFRKHLALSRDINGVDLFKVVRSTKFVHECSIDDIMKSSPNKL
ncbi:hypothetical protein Tco_1182807 [Tanacetum coccineum]